MTSIYPDDASFRDPDGFIYQREGVIYRQVNESYRENYALLMDSGLHAGLQNKQWMVPHREVSDLPFVGEGGFTTLQPEPVRYISYPYEWCFSQLKDAALLTLEIQKMALQHGMSLKDASAYNVQFNGSKPIFIDTLSFEKFTGKPWDAYKQFCQHFLAPLALISKTDYRLTKLLSTFIDGVPLDLAAKLLPKSTKFNLGLLTHIHMHAKSQKKYADEGRDEKISDKVASIEFSAEKASAIIDHLASTVNSLNWKLADTEWGDYYNDTNYHDAALREKAAILNNFCEQLPADCTLFQDLGANDGKFAREIAKFGSLIVCHDIDEVAVEKNYLAARAAKDQKMLPLVQDLSNPSASIGWANKERRSFSQRGAVDVSMALALIHHIAISNNIPFAKIAEYFSSLSRYLIIEFVAKTDSQVRRLLATREDIFTNYSIEEFEKQFGNYFEILEKKPISATDRTLYLLKRKAT